VSDASGSSGETRSRRRGNANQLVIISWRDIPAQINGQVGGERHQVMLPHRFQKAIDRAAMVADKKTAQEYVGEWQRRTVALSADADVVQSTDAEAARINDEYPNDRLHTLVDAGGFEPSRAEPPTPGQPPTTEEPTT
jgi:Virulence factor